MRIVFLGFQGWGLASLRALVDAGIQPVLVVTHPEGFRGHTAAFSESIPDFCRGQGIACLVAENIDASVHAAIAEETPDLLLTSNWRRVIPGSLIRDARVGAINVHRSLLPAYAGLSPLNWAIARGEERVGVTIHQISDVVDGGAIVAQGACEIAQHETATDAYHATGRIIGSLLPDAVRDVEYRLRTALPQNPALLEYFHVRGERERRIHWYRSAKSILDQIRAQSDPFENAFFLHARTASSSPEKISVKSARPCPLRYRGTAGRVVERDLAKGSVVVVAGDAESAEISAIQLLSLSSAGSAIVPAAEILKPGDYLL